MKPIALAESYFVPAALAFSLLTSSGALVGCRAMDPKPKRPPGVVGETSAPTSASGDRARPIQPKDETRKGIDTFNRGKVLADQGLLDQALVEFERAIAENPLLTPAYMGAGNVYMEQGNLPAAEQKFAKAAEIEPQNFNAQYLHALVLQEMGRLSEAIRGYLRALNLRPDDFKANSNLGATYLQVGEPREALPYARRAVEINPNDAGARTNLGVVLSALGQYEDAVTEFQQAAELAELSPQLLLNQADALGKLGRYEEMVNILDQVVRLQPTAVAYERLGSGLFRMQQYDESLAAFRKCVEIDPNHFPGHNGVGVCLMHQWLVSGQTAQPLKDEGLRALRRSLQIQKNQPKVMELVGRYR